MTEDQASTASSRPGFLLGWRVAVRRLDAAIDSVVDYRSLVPLRIAAGILVLIHLSPMLAASLSGTTYRDAFHVPVVSWYPELPEGLYVAAMWLAAMTAILVSIGFFTRPATLVTAGFAVYNLFLTETHYHHNRAFLAVLLVGLTLMPVGERISLDARFGRIDRPDPGMGPRWPLMLLRFQVAMVYAASGLSKLLDPDWFGGLVLQLRVAAQADVALERGVPAGIVELAASSGFQWWFAKIVIATELFIGLGLLWRRSRWLAVWLAIPFHLAIELSAEVEVFSYAGLAALVIWVAPVSGDRRLAVPAELASLVRALDWTGRFVVNSGERWSMVDRAEAHLSGCDAFWRCATLLPVSFWLAGPVSLVRRRRRARGPDRASVAV